ncbi:CoA pyrophosphatase [Rhodococcus triatomae]|uniref:NUDIX domain-containing protein n=1 Tax=Rhodococcus triatomae TaxID=300028 RepID=A0A1G8SL95_9NOCA|nr:CoA pyrophosphatase [Rhodococcus triatomae]QNG18708.1 CoA pyrophosphatase [Rhodococcus triatomae]QNG25381.1 CoA pyrophosphatase [Rhodococcus triatomae]SDJ29390.1 NUDIX domain-containing protein [Rhodococcus triatomae]
MTSNVSGTSPLDRDRLSRTLAEFAPRTVEPDGRRAASVVLAVMRDAAGGYVLPLTMRPGSMRAHAGQFALPGGSVDPGETAADAARRELAEELGVAVTPSEVLGRLDDYVTRSGFVITPFVVWTDQRIEDAEPNPAEVHTVFAVTPDELDVDPRFARIEQSPRPVIQWPFRGHLVHAPTGAVIHQFREVALHGRHTRVDEYEQPVFAWR